MNVVKLSYFKWKSQCIENIHVCSQWHKTDLQLHLTRVSTRTMRCSRSSKIKLYKSLIYLQYWENIYEAIDFF